MQTKRIRSGFSAWGTACSGLAATGAIGAAVVGAAGVDRVGEGAKRACEVVEADLVRHASAFLGRGEDARVFEEGEVARDDGEIDVATLGDFADAAGAATFREAGEQLEAGGISQCLEHLGVQERIQGRVAAGGLLGRPRARFAYLRHYASISAKRDGASRRE